MTKDGVMMSIDIKDLKRLEDLLYDTALASKEGDSNRVGWNVQDMLKIIRRERK
tara:strand:+ start:830 stop:991 length:162 start_codon:yes stop_codon:yes gene_type:complete